MINRLRKESESDGRDFIQKTLKGELRSYKSEGLLKRLQNDDPYDTRVEENVNDCVIAAVKSKFQLLSLDH